MKQVDFVGLDGEGTWIVMATIGLTAGGAVVHVSGSKKLTRGVLADTYQSRRDGRIDKKITVKNGLEFLKEMKYQYAGIFHATDVYEQMELKFTFGVKFLKPIKLTELVKLKASESHLNRDGVYLLYDSEPPQPITLDDLDKPAIVYIGKANRETIWSRNRKHYWGIKREKHKKGGNPKARPGRRFREYIKKIKGDPSKLWVVAGLVSVKESPSG
jgi:hypothetical protein